MEQAFTQLQNGFPAYSQLRALREKKAVPEPLRSFFPIFPSFWRQFSDTARKACEFKLIQQIPLVAQVFVPPQELVALWAIDVSEHTYDGSIITQQESLCRFECIRYILYHIAASGRDALRCLAPSAEKIRMEEQFPPWSSPKETLDHYVSKVAGTHPDTLVNEMILALNAEKRQIPKGDSSMFHPPYPYTDQGQPRILLSRAAFCREIVKSLDTTLYTVTEREDFRNAVNCGPLADRVGWVQQDEMCKIIIEREKIVLEDPDEKDLVKAVFFSKFPGLDHLRGIDFFEAGIFGYNKERVEIGQFLAKAGIERPYVQEAENNAFSEWFSSQFGKLMRAVGKSLYPKLDAKEAETFETWIQGADFFKSWKYAEKNPKLSLYQVGFVFRDRIVSDTFRRAILAAQEEDSKAIVAIEKNSEQLIAQNCKNKHEMLVSAGTITEAEVAAAHSVVLLPTEQQVKGLQYANKEVDVFLDPYSAMHKVAPFIENEIPFGMQRFIKKMAESVPKLRMQREETQIDQ